jgi:amino acid permease
MKEKIIRLTATSKTWEYYWLSFIFVCVIMMLIMMQVVMFLSPKIFTAAEFASNMLIWSIMLAISLYAFIVFDNKIKNEEL